MCDASSTSPARAMKYESPMKSAALFLGLLFTTAACTAPTSDEGKEATAADTAEADIAFHLDGTVRAHALVPDRPIVVTYDVRKLTSCGAPARLELFYLTAAGHTHVELGGDWVDGTTVRATIGPFAKGDLALWFHTANDGGCEDWDSAHGANYHFAIGEQPLVPTYEEVAPMIARACSGCHADTFGSLDQVRTWRDAMLDRILSGAMPRNNPNWRDSADGKAVLAFLRDGQP